MIPLLLSFLLFAFFIFTSLLSGIFNRKKGTKHRVNYYLQTETNQSKPVKNQTKKQDLKILNQWLKQKLTPQHTNIRLESYLQSAGVPWTPGEYLVYRWIMALITGGILYLLSNNNFVFLGLGIILGFFIPKIYVSTQRKKRLKKFNDYLADMITSIINSLKAGFSFVQALQSVKEEADSPVQEEIDHVLKEMQYGSTMEEALSHFYERMPSPDLDIMIQAILIQRQIGGNLATVLSSIVETIRERNKIQRQVKTLTAQGKLSGIVIGLLPFVLGFIIYLIQPSYINTLFTNVIGIALLSFSIISGTIGFLLIQKITKIEV